MEASQGLEYLFSGRCGKVRKSTYIRGWLNYYGRFHRSKCLKILAHLNLVLATWAKRRYKRFNGSWQQAFEWLERIAKRDGALFVLWAIGVKTKRLGDKSRMRRESHVRIAMVSATAPKIMSRMRFCSFAALASANFSSPTRICRSTSAETWAPIGSIVG